MQAQEPPVPVTDPQAGEGGSQIDGEGGSLNDLLQELRVLLLGSQVLTGFLVILPFYQGFAYLALAEKWVYVATFTCSLSSLILFSAPAAQHRLEWPLRDRVMFKRFATRMIIIGLVPLSLALTLATQLVVAQIFGELAGVAGALLVATLLFVVWWLFPLETRRQWATTVRSHRSV